MFKYLIRFGLISGLIVAAATTITFSFFDCNQIMQGGQVLGFSIMILALGTSMVLAILRYKKEKAIGIGQSILLCLGIGFFASLLYVIGWAFTYNFIVPEFMNQMMAFQEKQFALGKIEFSDIKMARQIAANYHNPFYFFLYTMVEIFPVAVILSLLIPTTIHFISKRKNATDPA